MARKVTQIYDAIIAYKDNQSFLQDLTPQNDTSQQLANDLNSDSKVAIWRLWAYTVAVAIWLHEVLWDLFKAEIEAKIANGIWGTVRWYQSEIFKFQFGDSLVYNALSGHYEYSVIDATKQIVKRCAVIESINGVLVIKVAKLNNNTPIPLLAAEETALTSYISKIKFAGTAVQIITGNGDLLRCEIEIIYDPITPVTIVAANVKSAINNYIANLDYNAQFRIIHLVDSIQKVEGVVDVIIPQNGIKTRLSAAYSYTPILAVHVPNYGYYKIDSTAGNTLDDTINYTII